MIAIPEEPIVFKVDQVAKMLGISENLTYKLIREGQLPVIRLGKRRILIPKEAFEKWFKEKLQN